MGITKFMETWQGKCSWKLLSSNVLTEGRFLLCLREEEFLTFLFSTAQDAYIQQVNKIYDGVPTY